MQLLGVASQKSKIFSLESTHLKQANVEIIQMWLLSKYLWHTNHVNHIWYLFPYFFWTLSATLGTDVQNRNANFYLTLQLIIMHKNNWEELLRERKPWVWIPSLPLTGYLI